VSGDPPSQHKTEACGRNPAENKELKGQNRGAGKRENDSLAVYFYKVSSYGFGPADFEIRSGHYKKEEYTSLPKRALRLGGWKGQAKGA